MNISNSPSDMRWFTLRHALAGYTMRAWNLLPDTRSALEATKTLPNPGVPWRQKVDLAVIGTLEFR
jgi:hypothetical protein